MELELDYKAIGTRIRDRRLKLGWSQERLSEAADLTKPHISHIENGHTKLSLPALVRLAAALGVATDELIFDRAVVTASGFNFELSQLCKGRSSEELALILSVVETMVVHFQQRGGSGGTV